MSELPEGWVESRIQDLIGIDGLFADGDWIESKDQDPSGQIRLLQLADIGDGRFLDKSNRFINDEQFERLKCTEVHEGDILIARMPDPIGRACVLPTLEQKSVTVVDVAILRPHLDINRRWLVNTINCSLVRSIIERESSGTTRKRIARGKLAEIRVPLAPLAEQKVIADKLDALLAQVDTLKARLDAIPAILKRFRQSVLSAAITGKLTEDWLTGAKPDWTDSSLAKLCTRSRIVTYGVVKLGDEEPDGVPCLRTSNVRWLKIDTDGVKRISPTISNQYARTVLEGGEVLVNVRGTLGGVAVVPPSMKGWNISREVAIVPTDCTSADPRYLALTLASEESQRWLSSVEKGVAYVGINIEDLRALPVKLPSLPEQIEIVRRVASLFAFADQIEARAQEATARVKNLTQSILAKAFRGELTEEWRKAHPELVSGENSAEALLERIRATRASATTSAPRGRPRKRGIV